MLFFEAQADEYNSYDCNDVKFHSSSGFSSTSDFEDYLKEAFDTLYQEGLEGAPKMMTIGLHCRITGKAGRIGAIKRFLEYISKKPEVWVTTRKDIAVHFRDKFPYKVGKIA